MDCEPPRAPVHEKLSKNALNIRCTRESLGPGICSVNHATRKARFCSQESKRRRVTDAGASHTRRMSWCVIPPHRPPWSTYPRLPAPGAHRHVPEQRWPSASRARLWGFQKTVLGKSGILDFKNAGPPRRCLEKLKSIFQAGCSPHLLPEDIRDFQTVAVRSAWACGGLGDNTLLCKRSNLLLVNRNGPLFGLSTCLILFRSLSSCWLPNPPPAL